MGTARTRACVMIGCIAFVAISRGDAGADDLKAVIQLDGQFFSALRRTPPIMRDAFLEERLHAIIRARGIVVSVDENPRFIRKHRIILHDRDAERHQIKIIYHLFAGSGDSISMVTVKGRVDFSGQLVAYTPVSSKRDAYILDVVLEKGAMLLE